jgi:large subunit ribosomal protein L19e
MTYDLTLQKRLSARIMKVSPKRIILDPAHLHDIKAAITKMDIKLLIADGFIKAVPKKGVSRARARHVAVQRSKGLRKGPGSKEGKATARNPSKLEWMSKVRAQRIFLTELKKKGIISQETYHQLYKKSKGGFFRSVRHIKIVLNEQNMALKPVKKIN